MTITAYPLTWPEGWRRAASAAHPEKGGSDEAMAEVNRAYQQALEAA